MNALAPLCAFCNERLAYRMKLDKPICRTCDEAHGVMAYTGRRP